MTAVFQHSLPPDLPVSANAITVGEDGIARVCGIPIANIVGLLESGCDYQDVLAVYGTGLNGLSFADVRAAEAYARA